MTLNKINLTDFIKTDVNKKKREYMDYFFSKIVGMSDKEPVYGVLKENNSFTISIVKDSTSRILDNARGKLMERSWRNCIFYFVDKEKISKYFGTNSNFMRYHIKDEVVHFVGNSIQGTSKNPLEPKMNRDFVNEMQKSVFGYFKTKHSSWFVRSYVYIILVVSDDNSEISSKNFYIHYWNTNYSFTAVNGKKKIFYNTKDSFFVEDINSEIELIETSNRDAIDCVKAYTGELDFFNQTDSNYVDIKSDINDGIEYVLVEGAARTGKTIIAMRLLGEFKKSNLLLMNYYFYLALIDAFKIKNIPFPKDRIYHHSLDSRKRNNGGWIQDTVNKTIIPNIEFLIVDEAQRLGVLSDKNFNGRLFKGIDMVDRIVNVPNHKHSIFFGDDFQKVNPDYDKGFKRIHDSIKNKNFRQYEFRTTIGIPPEILENVKFLLNFSNGGQAQSTNNFTISLMNDINKFISKFDSDEIKKKHFVEVALPYISKGIESEIRYIPEYPEELRATDYPYLFNDQIKEKYILSTYEVISREIESVYLYLPKEITYSFSNDSIGYKDEQHNEEYNEFLINQLYTLMTRATLNLTIYCEDSILYDHFLEKIQVLEHLNLKEQNDETESDEELNEVEKENEIEIPFTYDYDFFIAYHGTDNPKGSYIRAQTICDLLTSNGYKVFLNGYSHLVKDLDLRFVETTNVIQRSKRFLLVFNDDVPKDNNGMISRKNNDGKPNQLYEELLCFRGLVLNDKRNNKQHLKYYYCGVKLTRSNIYNFLNNFYQEGTLGNSSCCFFTDDELLAYSKKPV